MRISFCSKQHSRIEDYLHNQPILLVMVLEVSESFSKSASLLYCYWKAD
jgi:hypothetical protein